jgi:hypothetical protein
MSRLSSLGKIGVRVWKLLLQAKKTERIVMKKVLLWLWQFPQNLVGIIAVYLLSAYKPITQDLTDFYVHYNTRLSSVSLGNYIIIYGYNYTEETILHEKGHQKQSLYLGWFYLLGIGLPSVIGNLLHRIFKFDYYRQPWEAWADRLGGVKRNRI